MLKSIYECNSKVNLLNMEFPTSAKQRLPFLFYLVHKNINLPADFFKKTERQTNGQFKEIKIQKMSWQLILRKLNIGTVKEHTVVVSILLVTFNYRKHVFYKYFIIYKRNVAIWYTNKTVVN